MQITLRLFSGFLFLFSSDLLALAEDDDFWLLLDVDPIENVLWLYGGMDEFDGRYYGVAGDLAVSDPIHFIFSATQQEYFVDSTQLSWGFNSAINETYSVALFKDFWGKRNTMQKNDIRLLLSYYHSGFNAQFSHERGDVELYFRLRPNAKQRSVNIDHNASEISIGYRWPQYYWQLSHKQHYYQRELSLLQSRPRLQLIINPVGLQQASALAETESRLLLGYQLNKTFYEFTLSKIKSAVSIDNNYYAGGRISTALNNELQLALDIEFPVYDVPLSLGLSLGILW